MDLFQELAFIFGRIITIFPLLLVVALYMGKRSIGELPVFDFLVIITLANVTGADIADPNVEHTHTAFAIVVIALFQKIISKLIIKKRRFGKLITFEPTTVIKDGKILKKNLEDIQYTIDNVLQMLRDKNVFDISEVELAIVESNGKISVHKKSDKSLVTIEDLSVMKKSSGIAFPIIIDGVIDEKVLLEFQLSKEWLIEKLRAEGVSRIESVFFASINKQKDLHISLIDADPSKPSINH